MCAYVCTQNPILIDSCNNSIKRLVLLLVIVCHKTGRQSTIKTNYSFRIKAKPKLSLLFSTFIFLLTANCISSLNNVLFATANPKSLSESQLQKSLPLKPPKHLGNHAPSQKFANFAIVYPKPLK